MCVYCPANTLPCPAALRWQALERVPEGILRGLVRSRLLVVLRHGVYADAQCLLVDHRPVGGLRGEAAAVVDLPARAARPVRERPSQAVR
mgnify:CR=1 FL=1